MFSSRGYNIESLSVAPTDDPTVSRLTLVTRGGDGGGKLGGVMRAAARKRPLVGKEQERFGLRRSPALRKGFRQCGGKRIQLGHEPIGQSDEALPIF